MNNNQNDKNDKNNKNDNNDCKENINIKKLSSIFGKNIAEIEILKAEEKGLIPAGHPYRKGAIISKGWNLDQISPIGEIFGFLKKFERPLAVSVFTTKGGVLKTTLTLNLARIAALHNIRTLIIGLDMQGDITNALGHNEEFEESNDVNDIKEILAKINATEGLADVFNRTIKVENVVYQTPIPTLCYIPETPELAALNESLSNINRREYWLKEKIITPLKEFFDLIIMDCSPNWNRLITNALVAQDVLISPLECKINNFRNFKVFRHFLNEFKKDMDLKFNTIFVPTRYCNTKKLSIDIKSWYNKNLPSCTVNGIRESTYGEEASALKLSLIEHSPSKVVAQEMRDLFTEIFSKINNFVSAENFNNFNNFNAQEFNTYTDTCTSASTDMMSDKSNLDDELNRVFYGH
ncbi:MAG: ParA family protein [Oligoflexia bacterium]|nr:ParA family protein [Oligoflexia bacterium]